MIKLRIYHCGYLTHDHIHYEMGCGYEWIAQTTYGNTTNLSGEMTQYCPKCNARFSYASEMFYLKVDVITLS